MVCNPDGSIFIDSQYQVSPNLYDLAHTYQSGGWYWFNMTPSENIEFDRNKTLRVPNIRHNKQFFSTQYSWMANFEKENGYWPDWDWSFYQHRSYVNNYYTQENAYSWTSLNGFNARGGYIQVVDNAGNVSKELIF